jgi:hypothetical protein
MKVFAMISNNITIQIYDSKEKALSKLNKVKEAAETLGYIINDSDMSLIITGPNEKQIWRIREMEVE